MPAAIGITRSMLLHHPAQLASDRRYFLFCLAHLVSGRTDAILHQLGCDESVEEVICEGEKVILYSSLTSIIQLEGENQTANA